MADYSSLSLLNEYCAKNKLPKPNYFYIKDGEAGFVCKVDLLQNAAIGSGRKKRDAKHSAAAELNKKLHIDDAGGISTKSNVDKAPTQPMADLMTTLRNCCIQHDIPLPDMRLVQQAVRLGAPEFAAGGTVASLKFCGLSDNKKDAKQEAACGMLQIVTDHISSLELAQVTSFQKKRHEIELERYRKFKTYHELTESKSGVIPRTLLQDRHNRVTKFHPELKQVDQKVLASAKYECKKAQGNGTP